MNLNTIIFAILIMFSLFFVLEIIGSIRTNRRFIFRGLMDLLDAVSPLPKPAKLAKNKRRILIFNWRDTRHKFAGGAEVYIHELAKRWVEEGNQVTWFCGNDSLNPRNEVIEGIQIIRRGGFYLVYLWAFVYYTLRFRGRFDVVIDCQNGIPFFTPLYVKEKPICLMFHVHQKVFRKSLPKPLAAFAAALESKAMPWAYRNIRFITISKSTKKDMEELNVSNEEINVIYPGVDLQKMKPAKKSKKPMVLYLGRLKEYKSVDHFVKAARYVLNEVPNAQFIVAGDGEEKTRLKELTRKLGIQERVKFLGKVSDKEKVKLYQEAWVFVNPSYMEGWGITTIEANACGTPVIAADVPGLRDSVNNPHTGFLVKYGDVRRLGDRIVYLLENHEKRKKMANYSVKWARKFDWNLSSYKFLEIL